MTLSFDYRKLPQKKGGDVRVPAIPVTFKGNGSFPVEVIALIDSGADVSIIPKDLAELLNLNLSGDISTSYGIDKKIKVKNSRVEISVGKGHETHTFTIPVQVILEGDPPIILGRNTFFNKFIVSFDEESQKIKLKQKDRDINKR